MMTVAVILTTVQILRERLTAPLRGLVIHREKHAIQAITLANVPATRMRSIDVTNGPTIQKS
ncbi:hypothetical protein C0Z10_04985 [Acidipropionibacterium jensenii]|uniref:Uncharacterized protein n=1 Tax=Acidipropionibacterium jensenii TaxID=1749 RepID=A0A3Q9UDK8_9ACTN|nr:hypothetical protein C0Z10_04985 [Acidipropionibacterium jensenii]